MGVLDDVKSRLDIVDVVSSYVALSKAGRNFKAPCPFHNEKTPSFIVNPERQNWHCFGACSTGGDIFSFVMRQDGVEFGEALKTLAQKAGVELSENRRDYRKEDSLYQINQETARFYQDLLASEDGKQAMAYLEKRGVNEEARTRFGLGFSPKGRDGLRTHLLTLGMSEEQAIESGVLHRSENGNVFDFFRGRLMFPIHDRQGRIVGFGGRALDDSQPKYLNTGQTPLFNKQHLVYGLHLANSTIRAKNEAIIVEGYMDVVAAHQYGYTNVVASMGTALTESQVSQLKSVAKNFVLALDADNAGQEATLRSLESSWRIIGEQQVGTNHASVGVLRQRDPIKLRIAAIPEGRDPDDLIRENSGEWERLTENAVPLMDYLIPAVVAKFDIATGQGKTQAVETLLPSITAIDNDFDQEHYLNKLADAIGANVESVKATIGGLTRRRSSQRRQQPRNQGPVDPQGGINTSILSVSAEDAVEDFALSLLLQKSYLKEQAADFDPQRFNKIEAREVFTRWLSCSTMDELFESLDEELHNYVNQLTEKDMVPIDRQEGQTALAQCLHRLESRYLRQLQENLLAVENPNAPPARELEGAIADVNSKLKELFTQHV